MKIEPIGEFTYDKEFDWHYGPEESANEPIGEFQFVLEGYLDEKNKDDFKTAMEGFRKNGSNAIKEAARHIFEYYQDISNLVDLDFEDDFPTIQSIDDIWGHIRIGKEVAVSRREYGDRKVYLSIECGCDWEEEHGLQIVLKEGKFDNKVGSYDGHLTNSDEYDVAEYETVIYKKIS